MRILFSYFTKYNTDFLRNTLLLQVCYCEIDVLPLSRWLSFGSVIMLQLCTILRLCIVSKLCIIVWMLFKVFCMVFNIALRSKTFDSVKTCWLGCGPMALLAPKSARWISYSMQRLASSFYFIYLYMTDSLRCLVLYKMNINNVTSKHLYQWRKQKKRESVKRGSEIHILLVE